VAQPSGCGYAAIPNSALRAKLRKLAYNVCPLAAARGSVLFSRLH
jgi:hypothetical protein